MKDNWKITLIGSQVQLVPYQKKFVDNYHRWMCSPELLEQTASEPLSIEEEYEMQKTWKHDPYKCTFIILNKNQEANEIERMVGDVNLFMHDTEDRSNAEIEIMIAEEGARGKGIGKESLLLMIKFGIEKLKISRFFAKINTTNVSSIGLFRKLGFVEVNFVEAFQEHEFELLANTAVCATLLESISCSSRSEEYICEETEDE